MERLSVTAVANDRTDSPAQALTQYCLLAYPDCPDFLRKVRNLELLFCFPILKCWQFVHTNKPNKKQCKPNKTDMRGCLFYIGEGNGTPLQYSCLEHPMGRGAWWAPVHGVAKSRTRLSDFTFTSLWFIWFLSE